MQKKILLLQYLLLITLSSLINHSNVAAGFDLDDVQFTLTVFLSCNFLFLFPVIFGPSLGVTRLNV